MDQFHLKRLIQKWNIILNLILFLKYDSCVLFTSLECAIIILTRSLVCAIENVFANFNAKTEYFLQYRYVGALIRIVFFPVDCAQTQAGV